MNAPTTAIYHTFICALYLIPTAPTQAADDTWRSRFDRGLLQEELHQDLDKAIEQYQANVDAFDTQRSVIAMSLYRLAECYRKQGHIDKAAPLYTRVIREFSDQEGLFHLSQRFVPEENERTETHAISDSKKIQSTIQLLSDASPEKAMLILNKENNDPTAADLLNRLHESENKLAAMKHTFGEENPLVVTERLRLGSITEQMERHKKNYTDYLQSRLDDLAPENLITQVTPPSNRVFLDDHPTTLRALIKELESMSPPAALAMIEGETQVRLPTSFAANVAFSRAQLETAKARYRLKHPRFIAAKQELDDLEAALPAIVALAIEQLKTKLTILEKSPDLFPSNPPSSTAKHESIAKQSDPEESELKRYRKMAEEQPDLLIRPAGNKESKIHTAVRKGYLKVLRFFLDQGVDINLQDRSGRTPLHLAVASGNLKAVDLLLDQEGIQVDPLEPYHSTPLHIAASSGYLAIAKSLIAAGADINAKSRMKNDGNGIRSGFAPLPPLNSKRHRGSSPNTRRRDRLQYALFDYPRMLTEGNTPLHLSCKEGYLEFSEWLIDQGAAINATNRCGLTPLLNHLAHSSMPMPQHMAIVKLLLSRGADPNTMGEVVTKEINVPSGNIPHSTYGKLRNQNRVQISLFKHPTPADREIEQPQLSPSFMSPLHLAPAFGTEILRILLTHGADPNQPSSTGATPLHYLFYQKDERLIELFLKFHSEPETTQSIDPTARDSIGFMPGDHALIANFHLSPAKDLVDFVDREKLPDYVYNALWNYLVYAHPLKESLALLSSLLEYDPNAVNAPGPQNTTPLEHAILERKDPDLTNWLLNQGAKPTLTEKLRQTKSLAEQDEHKTPGDASKIMQLLKRLEE